MAESTLRASRPVPIPGRAGLVLLLCGVAWPAAALQEPPAATDPEPQVLEEPGREREPPPEEEEAEPIADVIEAEQGAQPSDADIEARLEEIFANLPSLLRVTVDVEDGVIVLGGTVDDLEASERAARLAERVSGAVIVVNNVRRDRSIRSRVNAAVRDIRTRLKDLAGNSPLLLLALSILAAALLVARLVGRAERLFGRLSRNWFIRDLLRQVVQLGIVLAGLVLALQLLDATALLGSIVGALGILGLAIGFATRDTVENYIASILLSVRQPFERDDYVRIEGTEGKVMRLTSRATVLMSIDGNHIRIPNAKVYKATIVNYTRNPLRRIEFDLAVDAEVDLAPPRELAIETLRRLPGVLATPAPACLVETLGDSRIILRAHAWIDQRESDYFRMKSEAQRAVKEAFDDAGIVMPEPIYTIKLRGRGRIGQREEPERRAAEARRPTAPPETSPDRSIEDQMRAHERREPGEDLLNEAAPKE